MSTSNSGGNGAAAASGTGGGSAGSTLSNGRAGARGTSTSGGASAAGGAGAAATSGGATSTGGAGGGMMQPSSTGGSPPTDPDAGSGGLHCADFAHATAPMSTACGALNAWPMPQISYPALVDTVVPPPPINTGQPGFPRPVPLNSPRSYSAIHGADGFLGVVRLQDDPTSTSPLEHAFVCLFDRLGVCKEQITDLTAPAAPIMYSFDDAAKRAGTLAMLLSVQSLGPLMTTAELLVVNGHHVDFSAMPNQQPRNMAISANGLVVVATDNDLYASNGSEPWSVRLTSFSPAGAVVTDVTQPGTGRIYDLAVGADDQVLVVSLVNAGQSQPPDRFRVDRYDMAFHHIDSYTTAPGLMVGRIAVNSSSHVAMAGTQNNGLIAWADVLKISGWASLGAAPLTVATANYATALELQDDDQLLLAGTSSNNGIWFMRFDAQRRPAWQTPRRFPSNSNVYTVARQSDGSVFLSGEVPITYCD